jgi:PAS domain S-box-containing protein
MGAVFVAYQTNKILPAHAASFLEIFARQLMALIRQTARHQKMVEAQMLTFHFTNQMAALKALITEGFILINHVGLVEDANTAGARMLGYRPEDIIGLPYQDVLVGDDALNYHLLQALAKHSFTEEQEGLLHRRNGETFPVKVRTHSMPETEGGCAVVLHDLSTARAEQTHREHVDHMAYVGSSAQAFAHEVRGPLNNIAIGVQYLGARLPEDDPLQSAVEKILAETSRLSDLMNNMLAWAKPIDPKPEPLDVSALLQRLMTRWATKLQQRHIQPILKLLASGPLVLADSQLLERVFINLIENAIQAMPPGGQLTVQVQVLERGPQGQTAEIRVMDTGPGIPEEHRRRIFDPYFTTKADGSGLGLAICKRILTVHRGAIDVESYLGVGTIFIITLPTLNAAAELPVPTRQEEMVV